MFAAETSHLQELNQSLCDNPISPAYLFPNKSVVKVTDSKNIPINTDKNDPLCGLVVRVLGYRSGGPDSIPDSTRKKSICSGTGSTQPREYN
jgi:hypothetical protein